ncbi:50S ribosomal protein L29 [Thermoflexus sp.]|uniref:50S ribosomal protein L29 n=1 Tax=Thermoflexus sp. TaxID=1969742 RepID=UPI0025DC600A|nr:50S ribosomal protein L29 [Thermoflexus sp.]MDW8065008.1 50S ribosomal protein L29 [Anaerolineae bacterium]MCS6963346.1 50S ribosomal protein L29 [Thermoflexus sp.]MCS7251456.1 50S ribosomal protein L29 [Thermoflexus sp.]MCS7350963.1 50S ribosomal protein L29 [Thermoflexus sp.]MCX7691151.1 50S ribosomal protein L29 [Thermoflexus sp.]
MALRPEEIRNWSDDELRNRLEQIRRELFNLRVQWVMGQLKDVNRIRALRKDSARILTIMRERELARGGGR